MQWIKATLLFSVTSRWLWRHAKHLASSHTMGRHIRVWMGDHLQAGKLSWYVASHPSQLSLAIPMWVGALSTSLGWEGNPRSGVALAMRHRQQWFIHLRAQRPMKGR